MRVPAPKTFLRPRLTKKGILIKVNELLIAVSETDNAVSPFARKVTRLEVGPPGEAAKMINPMAISAGISITLMRIKPVKGNNTSWHKRPMIIPFGLTNTLEKSAEVKESPIPNMMIMSEIAKIIAEIESIVN